MAHLKIVLLHGISGSGKTFATERLFAIDYQVATCRMDKLYSEALEHAGVPRPDRGYGIYRWARSLHGGECDPGTSAAFFGKLSELIQERLREAYEWRVSMVFEGYSLKFPDEVRMVRHAAEAIAGSFGIFRLQLTPTAVDVDRNRAAKGRRHRGDDARIEDVDAGAEGAEGDDADGGHGATLPPEPVEGVVDYSAADLDQIRELADERIELRRHRWYQDFTLGPVSTGGRIESSAKLDVVLSEDLIGKAVIDICCNAGAHAFLAKDRGAARVVGVENNPRNYCKARELTKVLRRDADVDARVQFLLGDVLELLPALGRFDTLLFFGALHYFPDYHQILGFVADAVTEAAYVDFRFSEGRHDTAAEPGAIRPWVRKTGKTIYMGDRETIVATVNEAMPGFEIEERTPMPRRNSDREIWRLRRTR